jgi:low affinity Fe/Cu permease
MRRVSELKACGTSIAASAVPGAADCARMEATNGMSTISPKHTTDKRSLMNDIFHRLSHRASQIVGSPWAFILAALAIVAWGLTGPIFGFSDTWQLVINTGTTIITFLMVFLIQNTQNRDARAIHLKLDELIRSKKNARNKLVDLEHFTDEERAEIEAEFKRLRTREGRARREGKPEGAGLTPRLALNTKRENRG